MVIIKEFMTDANEVGSTYIVQNYDLGISSATIRNEMVKLMEKGFLAKSHISSGRLPTDQAIRLYVQDVSSNPSLDSAEESNIKQEIFKVRFSPEQLIKKVLDQLTNSCNSASFMVMDDTSRYFGVSSLMKYEELRNIEVMQRILDLLEDDNLLRNVFSEYDGNEVSLLIGAETGIKDLEDCSIVFTRFNFLKGQSGHMGVIGSKRLDYAKVIPVIRTIRDSLEGFLSGWR